MFFGLFGMIVGDLIDIIFEPYDLRSIFKHILLHFVQNYVLCIPKFTLCSCYC